ncbi:MAG: lipopolysaccharide assembly protein LapA domain-containing protein [Alphaproteobacteria bacterium]|nr:lipopolysaccharide assembly protein LapA domain-containing protein [Alphaproteobacteria bacterium]
MKLLTWIILVPATVVVVAFAIANNDLVTVRLDPLPFAPEMPLYVLALILVFIGMLAGGLAASIGALRWRRAARRARREVMRLEGELRARQAASGRELATRSESISDAA